MIPEIVVAQVLRVCVLYVPVTSEHTVGRDCHSLQLHDFREFLLFLRRMKYEVMSALAHI